MAEVETSRDGGVLTITLNRPDVLNAFNGALHKQLGRRVQRRRGAATVRAVVVTGAGRGFCVGQDADRVPARPRSDIAERLRGELPPDDPRDARAREAGARGRQRPRRRRRALVRAAPATSGWPPTSATFVPAFINIGLVPDIGRHLLRHPSCSGRRARSSG